MAFCETELPRLTLPEGIEGLFLSGPRSRLEREILAPWLHRQRWFAGKGSHLKQVRCQHLGTLAAGGVRWFLGLLEVHAGAGTVHRYHLPFSLLPPRRVEASRHLAPCVLARVPGSSRGEETFLCDAFADSAFVAGLVRAVRNDSDVRLLGGTFQCAATEALTSLSLASAPRVEPLGVEQSNTSLRVGPHVLLKAYRRLTRGVHPEAEMGRFLTEQAGFSGAPAFLGHIGFDLGDGVPMTLCTLHRVVPHEADAWTVTARFLAAGESEGDQGWHQRMSKLGAQTGTLHRALCQDTGNAAFDPEPVTTTDVAEWQRQVRQTAETALDRLAKTYRALPSALHEDAERVVVKRDKVPELIASLTPSSVPAVKIRTHGDLHLGQVLVAGDDFYFIDFEGEPERPVDERRRKQLGIRDVAGMLRSFSYAAASAARVATEAGAADAARRQWLARWERSTAQAYLAGYAHGVAGTPLWPADRDTARRLLDLFVLEKCFYELAYELAQRPEWVPIPLRAIIDMLLPSD